MENEMRMMIRLKEQDRVEFTTPTQTVESSNGVMRVLESWHLLPDEIDDILAYIEDRESFLEENGYGFYLILNLVWRTSRGTVTISFPHPNFSCGE